MIKYLWSLKRWIIAGLESIFSIKPKELKHEIRPLRKENKMEDVQAIRKVIELLLDTDKLKNTEGFWVDIVPEIRLGGKENLKAKVYNVRTAFTSVLQILERIKKKKIAEVLQKADRTRGQDGLHYQQADAIKNFLLGGNDGKG